MGDGLGDGVTWIVPVIEGKFVSWYGNVPGSGKVREKLPPGWIGPESQMSSSEVDVCVTESSLTHVIVVLTMITKGFTPNAFGPSEDAFCWM